jgi:hypothetical protein
LSGCGCQDKQGELFLIWRVSFVVDGISGMKQFGHLLMSPTGADQRQGSIQVIESVLESSRGVLGDAEQRIATPAGVAKQRLEDH